MAKRLRSGLRPIPAPSKGASSLEIAEHYLKQYESEFIRARQTVKSRARLAVWFSAIGAGSIGLLGAVSAAFATSLIPSVIGIVTALVGGSVAAVAAWDSHFHHKELWVQRSLVLNDLQRVRVRHEHSLSSGARPSKVAKSTLVDLDDIMRRDVRAWSKIHDHET